MAPSRLDDPARRGLDPAVSSDVISTTRHSWCGVDQVVRRRSGGGGGCGGGGGGANPLLSVYLCSGSCVVRQQAVVVGLQAAASGGEAL
jgi:hypothetical protein